MNYRHCTVEKQSSRKGVWVAEDCAKIGAVVEFDGDSGWVVCKLSGMVFPLELAMAQSRDPIAKMKEPT